MKRRFIHSHTCLVCMCVFTSVFECIWSFMYIRTHSNNKTGKRCRTVPKGIQATYTSMRGLISFNFGLGELLLSCHKFCANLHNLNAHTHKHTQLALSIIKPRSTKSDRPIVAVALVRPPARRPPSFHRAPSLCGAGSHKTKTSASARRLVRADADESCLPGGCVFDWVRALDESIVHYASLTCSPAYACARVFCRVRA